MKLLACVQNMKFFDAFHKPVLRGIKETHSKQAGFLELIEFITLHIDKFLYVLKGRNLPLPPMNGEAVSSCRNLLHHREVMRK
ncbi:hypothetical protein K0U00_17550 [Paenibacillus sepulcri]|uniref:Uncharacterized protein n=1 Tax=Paenibacillus sepulcri TaxID=359917 RepID=A0ABS7C4J5_9BACL|nr:hypothetical protein [Paenibacillus sepulcri]